MGREEGRYINGRWEEDWQPGEGRMERRGGEGREDGDARDGKIESEGDVSVSVKVAGRCFNDNSIMDSNDGGDENENENSIGIQRIRRESCLHPP